MITVGSYLSALKHKTKEKWWDLENECWEDEITTFEDNDSDYPFDFDNYLHELNFSYGNDENDPLTDENSDIILYKVVLEEVK